HFDEIVARAARLVCVREEFAGLWESVMGQAWTEACGATDPLERQRLRDEIDAWVAHLFGLDVLALDHILGSFPLVFTADEAGEAKRSALLETFESLR
ncbi:MAG: hypothetical protein D6711_01450, partial [Chloroflexi bacterium]